MVIIPVASSQEILLIFVLSSVAAACNQLARKAERQPPRSSLKHFLLVQVLGLPRSLFFFFFTRNTE